MVAIEEGEGNVEQNKLGIECCKLRQDIAEISHAGHFITPAGNMFFHRLGDDRVILHNENPVHSIDPQYSYISLLNSAINSSTALSLVAQDVTRRISERSSSTFLCTSKE